jgi:hypothetical protein
VHELPADLREALIANATALDAWKDITPLARNEFICWVWAGAGLPPAPEDAKQGTTRERRIRRTQEGCWPGCKHRETHRQVESGDRRGQKVRTALVVRPRNQGKRLRDVVRKCRPQAFAGSTVRSASAKPPRAHISGGPRARDCRRRAPPHSP